MKKFIYLHGLGSDKSSRKYLILQDHFKTDFEMDCWVWKNDSNMEILLQEWFENLKNEHEIILFGDSTGANFAYQIWERRKLEGLKTRLILSSPLLNESKRIANFPFPENLKTYLKNIENPVNALLILPLQDEVIDNSELLVSKEATLKIIPVEDSHRLLKFEEYLGLIRKNILALDH